MNELTSPEPISRTPAASRQVRWRALISPGGRGPCAVLLAIYLGITALGVATHEPWRDEAQKWLLARDTASFGELLRFLPLEGSPALWPLLLRPLARGGLPYASMQWLNWTVMGGAAAILLFAAPLPWPLKTVVLFSHYLLYQYPVITGGYSLSVFLLFAALAVYPLRRRRPLAAATVVFLLANSTVAGAVSAVPLAALLLWERIRETGWPPWRLVLPIGAGYSLLVFQLTPQRLGQGASLDQVFAPIAHTNILQVLNRTFFAPIPMAFPRLGLPEAAWSILVLVFFLLLFGGLAKRPRALFLLAAATGLLLLLLSRFFVGTRHMGFLFLAVPAALWLAMLPDAPSPAAGAREAPAGAPRSWVAVVATLVLGVSTLISFPYYRKEIRNPFSCSREMARRIAAQGLERLPLAAFPSGAASALLPYLPGVRFFYGGIDRWGTFAIQSATLVDFEAGPPAAAIEHLIRHFPPGSPFLLLLNQPPGDELAGRCVLLESTTSPGTAEGENYWLSICNRHPAQEESP